MIFNQQTEQTYLLVPPFPTSYVIPFPYVTAPTIACYWQRKRPGKIPSWEQHPLVYGTDYTVTAPAIDDTGGTLTILTSIPAEAEQLVIRRETPVTQETHLHDNAKLRAVTLENIADKSTMEIQEIKNSVVNKDELQEIIGQIDEALEEEAEAREQADAALGVRIDVEEAAREQEDIALGVRIDAEEAAREQEDASLGGRIDAETQARAQADAYLGVLIDTETQARTQEDAALGDRIDAEEAAREQEDIALGDRIDADDLEIAELQAFHQWNAQTQYAPYNPVFYLGFPYYANPENMPLAGQSPAAYPAKWMPSGGEGGGVTVDTIPANVNRNIQLKYFVTKAEYTYLQRKGRLIAGARYIITDRSRLPSVSDFGWMFTAICGLLDEVAKKLTEVFHDGSLDGEGTEASPLSAAPLEALLTAEIEQEAADRAAAISAAVGAEAQARDGAITAAIGQEVTNRDAAIGSAIGQEVIDRDAAIGQEAQARNAAIGAAVETTLADEAASDTLPATTKTGFAALFQTVRNFLKWVKNEGLFKSVTAGFVKNDGSIGYPSKADVGLGNVDNTSDVDKPVSTAQGQAIADIIKFKNLEAARSLYLMGNEVDGGYIQGITYYDDAKGHLKTHGAFAMNGQYPQYYYKTYAYVCADIAERDALTGVDWALCIDGGPDGANALYNWVDTVWMLIGNRSGHDEENSRITRYVEETRDDGGYYSTALTGFNWVKAPDKAYVDGAVASEAAARDAAIAQARLASQTWLPSVDTQAELKDPSLLDPTINYLCRVIADPVKSNNGVWQLIQGANAWTFYSNDIDFVDDLELAAAIDAEVTNRNAAIAGAISNEASNRDAAINAAIAGEVTDRNTAISAAVGAEAQARDTAIGTAISQEVIDRDAAIGQEAQARDAAIGAAISQEVTDRDAAISQEVTDRNSAITTAIGQEVTDRNSAISAAIGQEVIDRDAAIEAVQDDIDTHKDDKANPHEVTKAQVGLGNVDNTADMDKPVSTAQGQAIADAKLAVDKWLPAVTTKAQLADPTTLDRTVNYLCRVISDPTASNNGVWQLIADANDWTYFSDNMDFIDETELAAAINQEVTDRDAAIGSAISQEVIDRDTAIEAAVETTLIDAPASPALPPLTKEKFADLLQATRNTLKYLEENAFTPAFDGYDWVNTGDTLTDLQCNRAAYGAGKYVITTSNGVIAYSIDGISWTRVSVGTPSTIFNDVAYGGDRFVAVGPSGLVAYSTDGINWTTVSYTIEVAMGVAYGNGMFVCGGGIDHRVHRSPDGINWYYSIIDGYELRGVGFGNGLFMLADAIGNVSTSPNGINWTGKIKLPNAGRQFVYGAGKWVTVLDNYMIGYSLDNGSSWTLINFPNTIRWRSLAYAEGRFVAASLDGSIYISTDGITWTNSAYQADAVFVSVVYGENAFIAFDAHSSTLRGFFSRQPFVKQDASVGYPTKADLLAIYGADMGNSGQYAFVNGYGPLPAPINAPPVGISVKMGAGLSRFYSGSVTLRQVSSAKTVKFDYTIFRDTVWRYPAITKLYNDYQNTDVFFYIEADGYIYLYIPITSGAGVHVAIEATCRQTPNGSGYTGAVTYLLPEFRWEAVTPTPTDKTSDYTIPV